MPIDYHSAEPFLDDARVGRIAERLFLELPGLPIESKFAALTDGNAMQFIVYAPHPRPIQKRYGVQHGITFDGWYRGWLEVEKERGHFVHTKEDPAFPIFRALAFKMVEDMASLNTIMN